MKGINISEDQLKKLRTQLTDQLKDVLGKVEFIQGFLEMLGASPSAPAKRGRKAKAAPAKPAAKRGRPAKKADAAPAKAKAAASTGTKKRGRPAKKETAAAAKAKTNGKATKASKTEAAPAKRGRKPKAASAKAVAAKPKKRGRKKVKPAERNSKWGGFILNTFKKERNLYTTNKLIEQAVKEYNLNAKEAASVKTAISASLFRLMNVNKKVAAYKVPGRKGKYYGLTSWFDGAEIKKMYRGRLIH